MKKIILLISLIAGMGAVVFAQTAALPRLAVVEFSTNVNTDKAKADAVTVRNLVRSQMVATGKYRIMTRDEIDKLLANQRIQVSSISSAENIGKLKLENVNYIVTGSVDAMGDDYAVTVQVLDVFNGEFSHSDDAFMGGSGQELYNGINSFMTKFVAGMTTEGDKVTQTGTGQKYNIGDRGPGGGFIFYAEGGVFMEVSLTLGSYNWDQAVEVAKNHRGGGFTDWRLPSRSELNMIYENLRKKNLAGLGDDEYWSSTEYDNGNAWIQRFSDGEQYTYSSGNHVFSKNKPRSVRAVRAF